MSIEVKITKNKRIVWQQGGKKPVLTPTGRAASKLTSSVSHKAIIELERAGLVEDKLNRLAESAERRLSRMSGDYFIMMVKGCTELANDSTVPAQWDEDDNLKKGKKVKGGTSKAGYMRKTQTSSFSAIVRYTGNFGGADRPIEYGVSWKKLTRKYAMRTPISKKFFFKRDKQPSARMQFLDDFAKASKLARQPSRYAPSGVKTKYNFDVNTEKSTLTATYRLRYPNLGKFNFLRRAFLDGNKPLPDITNFGEGDGFLRAESVRPLLRPFAREVGKAFLANVEKMSKELDELK